MTAAAIHPTAQDMALMIASNDWLNAIWEGRPVLAAHFEPDEIDEHLSAAMARAVELLARATARADKGVVPWGQLRQSR